MGNFIEVEISDGIATLTLARPPMNVLNAAMQDELQGIVARLATDSAVRVVVITGGLEVFAAGADVKEMVGLTAVEMKARAP